MLWQCENLTHIAFIELCKWSKWLIIQNRQLILSQSWLSVGCVLALEDQMRAGSGPHIAARFDLILGLWTWADAGRESDPGCSTRAGFGPVSCYSVIFWMIKSRILVDLVCFWAALFWLLWVALLVRLYSVFHVHYFQDKDEDVFKMDQWHNQEAEQKPETSSQIYSQSEELGLETWLDCFETWLSCTWERMWEMCRTW